MLKELGGFDSFIRIRRHFNIFTIGLQCKGHEFGLTSGHRYTNSEIYKLHICTCTVMNTWREEIVPWKTLALIWLQTFLRLGQHTLFGDVTWPQPAIFFLLRCAQWIVGKSHKVWAEYLEVFGNVTRKPEGGGLKDSPPPEIGLNAFSLKCLKIWP